MLLILLAVFHWISDCDCRSDKHRRWSDYFIRKLNHLLCCMIPLLQHGGLPLRMLHNSTCLRNKSLIRRHQMQYCKCNKAVHSALFTDQRKTKLRLNDFEYMHKLKYQLKVWKYDWATSVKHLFWLCSLHQYHSEEKTMFSITTREIVAHESTYI